jgi:hypothetical protein
MKRSDGVSIERHEGSNERGARRARVGRTPVAAGLLALAAFAMPSLASAQDAERAAPSASASPAPLSRIELAAAHRPGRVTLGAFVGSLAGAAASLPGAFLVLSTVSVRAGNEVLLPGIAAMVIPAQFAIAGTVYGLGAAFHGAGGFWLTYAGTWVGTAAGAGLIAGGVALAGDASAAGWFLIGLGSLMPVAGALVAYELSSSARLSAAQQASQGTTARTRVAPLVSLAPTRDGVALHLAGQF